MENHSIKVKYIGPSPELGEAAWILGTFCRWLCVLQARGTEDALRFGVNIVFIVVITISNNVWHCHKTQESLSLGSNIYDWFRCNGHALSGLDSSAWSTT